MTDKTKYDNRPNINWDRDMLERFKKRWEAVVVAQLTNPITVGETFTFEGHEFVPDYAKYLIEYLEGVLEK